MKTVLEIQRKNEEGIYEESRAKIPHSETIEKCSGCDGRGNIVCPTCNANQEPIFYKENQMTECPACYGRGLIAHKDGSDTKCVKCNGKGKIPCATCAPCGLIKCETCNASGSLRSRKVTIVGWHVFILFFDNEQEKQNPVTGRHFQLEKLVQQVEQHQSLMKFSTEPKVSGCATLRHINAFLLFLLTFSFNKFSSEVIAARAPVPPSSRVICERHTISVVPVTRVTMSHRNRSLISFYIIGFSREVYLKDYYPSRFCWGLCPYLEWLKL
nr:isoform 2 of protein ssuh2 like [Quercus suber]